MIFLCKNGEKVDTSRLSPAERHVIQKLMAWQSLASSLTFFKEKIASALSAGWNDSGPLPQTRALTLVIEVLEDALAAKFRERAGK